MGIVGDYMPIFDDKVLLFNFRMHLVNFETIASQCQIRC